MGILIVLVLILLLAIPLLTLGICLLLPLDRTIVCICVTMAAMPAGANTAMFAELYTSDASPAASVISISTLLSIGTIPLMLWVTDQAFRLLG